MKDTKDNVLEQSEEINVIEPKKTEDEQLLHDLQIKRIGKFKLSISLADAVYFRNLLDKSDYKGPQQAYLLVLAKAEISSIVDSIKDMDKLTRHEVELSSACIESLGFFINNYTGKGSDSAMKLFSASMLIRQVIGQINELDENISKVKKNIETLDK